ncbi:MAG: hypothetical protein NPIRA05_11940 [Nitrospirales bacterium]|nr:MAG: hypothetical protein NPIRA05_11940 [Nitrospirales bacterium]
MGRPKKDDNDTHSKIVPTRFTKKERAELEQFASTYGITRSAFIRRRALGHRLPPPSTDQEVMAKVSSELLRLGVNLNQIARAANIKEKVLSNMLYELIVRINETLDELDESRRN